MKKVFALIAIVGFVACNNAEVKTETVDTAAVAKAKADSIAKAAAATVVDTTKKADTTKPAAPVEAPKK